MLDLSWTNILGDKLIWQLPDEMVVGTKGNPLHERFGLLMLFRDGNRIDLTLIPKSEASANYKVDSLTVVWLDKDNMFSHVGFPNDSDYLVSRPTEKQFLDTCNEFWWVCTYVAKGLVRNEIIYSKEMLESVVRPMFMNVIAWHVGIETDFLVSVGKGGKFMKNFLPPDLYNDILQTYSDHTLKDNWRALFLIMRIFGRMARTVAASLKFNYVMTEETNVTAYVEQLCREQSEIK